MLAELNIIIWFYKSNTIMARHHQLKLHFTYIMTFFWSIKELPPPPQKKVDKCIFLLVYHTTVIKIP